MYQVTSDSQGVLRTRIEDLKIKGRPYIYECDIDAVEKRGVSLPIQESQFQHMIVFDDIVDKGGWPYDPFRNITKLLPVKLDRPSYPTPHHWKKRRNPQMVLQRAHNNEYLLQIKPDELEPLQDDLLEFVDDLHKRIRTGPIVQNAHVWAISALPYIDTYATPNLVHFVVFRRLVNVEDYGKLLPVSK